MAQTTHFRGVATSIRKEGVWTIGRYHSTDVARFARRIDGVNEIVLNSGGWMTNTTKTRMVQFANQFNLNYGVFQRDGEWFVQTWRSGDDTTVRVQPFRDNMLILTK